MLHVLLIVDHMSYLQSIHNLLRVYSLHYAKSDVYCLIMQHCVVTHELFIRLVDIWCHKMKVVCNIFDRVAFHRKSFLQRKTFLFADCNEATVLKA